MQPVHSYRQFRIASSYPVMNSTPVSVLLLPQRSRASCAESGDFVQLLGGNGIDTSKLLPITDLCISFTGPSELAGRPLPALVPVPRRFRASTWCFDCLLFFFFPFVSAHMKIGCENTVVRMVSSGKFVSRVSFSYRLLDNQELQTIKLNNVEDFCFNNWSFQNWKHEVKKWQVELIWFFFFFLKTSTAWRIWIQITVIWNCIANFRHEWIYFYHSFWLTAAAAE